MEPLWGWPVPDGGGLTGALQTGHRSMEWRDVGIILSCRRHGEGSVIASLLTAEHGRHQGLLRGGGGSPRRTTLQPGTLVSVRWSARLEEHLGVFRCEAVESSSAVLLDDADRLAALASMCALVDWAVQERHPYGLLYDASLALLAALHGECWLAAYIHWELILLAQVGFALDLAQCAVTGQKDNLVWVSPKSGCAVSAQVGAPYAERLLPLPAFLRPGEDLPVSCQDQTLRDGLRLTGYFLHHRLETLYGRSIPDARGRLAERIFRQEAPSNVSVSMGDRKIFP